MAMVGTEGRVRLQQSRVIQSVPHHQAQRHRQSVNGQKRILRKQHHVTLRERSFKAKDAHQRRDRRPSKRGHPVPCKRITTTVGLQVGDPETEVTSALVCLDCTEAVVEEAAKKGCGLIISHHPVIFKGLKSLVAQGLVERTILAAIKHDMALYAIHTNLDNVVDGVNGEIASRLGPATHSGPSTQTRTTP